MILGRYLLHRRYTSRQVVSVYSSQLQQVPDPSDKQLAVLLVSIGVSIASISTSSSSNPSIIDVSTTYLYGILMLIASLFATAILGILQERTYRAYGPCWREGVFYTVRQPKLDLFRFCASRELQHLLSLPIFIFLRDDIRQGFRNLSVGAKGSPISLPYIFLAMNLLTQVVCVSGVNKLTSVRSNRASTARLAS